MKIINYFFIYLFLLTGISKTLAQENKNTLGIELIPIVKNKSVYFKYSLKNHSQDTIVFNIASTSNCAFFTLLIDDQNGKRVSTKTPLVRINYKYMFEWKRHYITLKPNAKFTRKYKTYGFNFKGKKFGLLKLKLSKGKYIASLVYDLEEKKLHLDNIIHPLYKKLWSGELQSEKIEFIIE